ILAVLNEEAV
ncbi:ADIPOR-like receptor SPBC12C2.09c, partial [Fusarium oxysporum f. sp. albedinis]